MSFNVYWSINYIWLRAKSVFYFACDLIFHFQKKKKKKSEEKKGQNTAKIGG